MIFFLLVRILDNADNRSKNLKYFVISSNVKNIQFFRFPGKKRTNRKEQIELLTELLNISKEHNLGEGMAIKIQFAICAAIFDYNPKISAAIKSGKNRRNI